MHPLLPLVVAELHRQDLLRDAAADRFVSQARDVGGRTALWRRAAGRAVDLASHALEGAANRLDPSLHPRPDRRLERAH